MHPGIERRAACPGLHGNPGEETDVALSPFVESALTNAAVHLLHDGVSQLEGHKRCIAAAIEKAASRGHPGVRIRLALSRSDPASLLVFESQAVESPDQASAAAYPGHALALVLRQFVQVSCGCDCDVVALRGCIRMTVHFLAQSDRPEQAEQLYYRAVET